MKFKLGLLNTAPLTPKHDLAMKVGSYRQCDPRQGDQRSCEEDKSSEDPGRVGRQTIDGDGAGGGGVGVGGHSTKYGSSCSLTTGCAHTPTTGKNVCSSSKYLNKLNIVSNCRGCVGSQAGCGSPTRERSPSTSSSDSTATNSTSSTDFDGSSSSSTSSVSNKSITSGKSKSNSSGSNSSASTNKSTGNDCANNMSSSSGSVSSDSSALQSSLLKLKTDIPLPNLMKKRRVCGGPATPAGLLLSRLSRRSGRPQDTPHSTKINSLNIKFNIFNSKTNNLSLKPDGINKANTLDIRTNSLNIKTNSLSSNSSCDSKASSGSTKSLRSLFSRGNVFSSSFTFGKSSSSCVESRALACDSAVTNTNIVIIGDKGVGKSAVTVRFLTRRYIGEYSSDNEMEYQHSTMVDHTPARLHLLDAATPQAPHQILRHLSWADAFIVVYDVTSRTSFVHARQLLHVLHTHTRSVADGQTGRHKAKTKDGEGEEGPHSLEVHPWSGEDTWTCTGSQTHSLSGLNRHTNDGQDTLGQKGHEVHAQNDQDPHTWSGPDTHSWNSHGVYGLSARTHRQTGHTRLKYDHTSCKSPEADQTEPSCRYCTTSTSPLVPSPAVLSHANLQRHNHAPDYIHPGDGHSQHVSQRRRITSHGQVDNHINSNRRHVYRHHHHSHHTTSQSHNIDTQGNHTIQQYKSHDTSPPKYSCVSNHDPHVHIQNSAHPLVLASLHSCMSVTKQEQETKAYESSCPKSLSNQIHLQSPCYQIQMKYPHQSLPQHTSSSRAHQKDQSPNHSHLLDHSPNQSHLKGRSPNHSHLGGHSPNYSHQGHSPDHISLKNHHSLDPSRLEGPSYLRDHRTDHSHLRSHSPDYSSLRSHSPDHSHLGGHGPDHNHLRGHGPDHNHLRGHGPNHSHLRSYTTLLLGNKRDLEHYRCVWTDEGEALSLEFSCQFYEVSAAESVLGVHLAFHSLLKEARALQYIRSLPQQSAKASKSMVSSAVSKVIGNFFTRAGKTSHKEQQSNSI